MVQAAYNGVYGFSAEQLFSVLVNTYGNFTLVVDNAEKLATDIMGVFITNESRYRNFFETSHTVVRQDVVKTNETETGVNSGSEIGSGSGTGTGRTTTTDSDSFYPVSESSNSTESSVSRETEHSVSRETTVTHLIPDYETFQKIRDAADFAMLKMVLDDLIDAIAV